MKKGLCLLMMAVLLLTSLPMMVSYAEEAPTELHFITRRRGEGYEENTVKKMIEEKFNVSIRWEVLPSEGYTEACQVILASGDYPDMMEIQIPNVGTEIPLLAEDGVLAPLNDLLAEYGSNILADRTEDYLWLWVDGERYNIPCRYVNVSETYYTIRQDWLDALNLEMPTTLAELKEVARAFTQDDPDGNGIADTYGIGGSLDGNYQSAFSVFLGAYGGSFGWADVDGAWMPWMLQDETRAALAEMREWYQEGIIEPDFMLITRDEYLERKSLNRYGVELWYMTQTGSTSAWWNTFISNVPQQRTAVMPVLAAEGYEAKFPRQIGANAATGSFQLLIFEECEAKEKVMEIIDYLATDEGADLVTFGPKGVTWDEVDGEYVSLDADTETVRQSGRELYHVIFWHNIYKRDADQLVKDGLEALDGYMVYGNYMPYTYEGDTSALESLTSTRFISMIIDEGVNVDEAFAAFVEEYLSMGGQGYIDWYNEKLAELAA